MSMITGCPACGTLFRVVPDQLRISEGWVRCGHCGEVFDATGNLQPEVPPAEPPVQAIRAGAAEPEAAQAQTVPQAPPGTEPAPQPQAGLRQQEPVEGATAAEVSIHPDVELEPEPESEPLRGPGPLPRIAAPAGADPAANASDFPRDSQPPESAPAFDYARAFREEDAADVPPADAIDSGAPDSTLENVSFVRQARRQAFWRRPLVRFALLLLALALAALLALQFALRERDRLAATQPQLRPLLEQLCGRLGCAIGAPRRIESIVIDNSGFSRVRPDVYRLSFTLKNPSPLPVAVPALQLTLTDTQEQPVVQRVILPAELGAAPATIAAASDWSASVALAVSPEDGATRIAGYRLLAFYP